jgi:hypothetical protein
VPLGTVKEKAKMPLLPELSNQGHHRHEELLASSSYHKTPRPQRVLEPRKWPFSHICWHSTKSRVKKMSDGCLKQENDFMADYVAAELVH